MVSEGWICLSCLDGLILRVWVCLCFSFANDAFALASGRSFTLLHALVSWSFFTFLSLLILSIFLLFGIYGFQFQASGVSSLFILSLAGLLDTGLILAGDMLPGESVDIWGFQTQEPPG